jgi:signal transduction histidine kinase
MRAANDEGVRMGVVTEERDGVLERVQRLERQLQAVCQITAALQARTRLDELERQTLLAAVDVVAADAGSILLHDATSAQLIFKCVLGPAAPMLTGQAMPDTKGIVGQVFQSGEGRITLDVTADKSHTREVDDRTQYSTRNTVTVPLKTLQGQVIGVMQVLNKKHGSFDPDDLAVLAILANLAASAIDTARLYEEARLAEVVHRIGDISHDIKNMVTPVVTGTQTLELMLQAMFTDLDGTLDEPGAPPDLAARIRSACAGVRDWYPEAVQMTYDGTTATQERVREIADAIKGIVAAPHFEAVNVNKVAELVAKTLWGVAGKEGVTIDLAGLGNVPTADLDWKRVHSAFYNLVSNAIPETPRGGTIFLRTSVVTDEAGEERLQIEVADTGRGMPPHIKARLFSPQGALSTKPGGTGIGTQIVKNVVDAHRGTITVESEPGAGTTFRIRLPLTQSEGES